MTRRGCLWPVMVSLGATMVVLLATLLLNRDVVRQMWSNAREASRGLEEARAITEPGDVLRGLASGDLQGSLIVLDASGAPLARAGDDEPVPVVGLDRMVVLDRLQAAVERGEFAWNERVPLAGLQAMRYQDEGRSPELGASGVVTVEQVALAMLHEGDQAAQDYLILRLREGAEASAHRAASAIELPVPMVGLFLLWTEQDESHDNTGYGDMSPDTSRSIARSRALQMAERLGDRSLGDSIRLETEPTGPTLSVSEQARLAEAHFSRGTSTAFGRLLLQLMREPRIDTLLSRPDSPIRSVGGAFPGMISLAAGISADSTAANRVAVLLLHHLPGAIFTRLVNTGLARAALIQALLMPERLPGPVRADSSEG